MYVKIRNYPSTRLGSYELSEKIFWFLSEERQDKIGEWIYNSKLGKFLEWRKQEKSRKIKIRIDSWDVWNLDETLAIIVVPLLKTLKDNRLGSAFVDQEDVPSSLTDVHERWDWVLEEMIWVFEHIRDEEIDFYLDSKKTKEHEERKQNGLRLFAKYYNNLWD